MAVREMMERHWSLAEISVKLNLDYDDVRIIADIIDNLLT
jgi:hypothetical protein